MRTRSQTRSQGGAEELLESGDRGDGGGLGDTSAPAVESENQQLRGRSSVNILPPAAFQSQTQPVEICSADISEPVLKITDRRIRELLAKSTTDKRMLKSSME